MRHLRLQKGRGSNRLATPTREKRNLFATDYNQNSPFQLFFFISFLKSQRQQSRRRPAVCRSPLWFQLQLRSLCRLGGGERRQQDLGQTGRGAGSGTKTPTVISEVISPASLRKYLLFVFRVGGGGGDVTQRKPSASVPPVL